MNYRKVTEPIDLFKMSQELWAEENINLFGLTPVNEHWSFEEIQNSLTSDCAKYWNGPNPCEVAAKMLDGTLNKQGKDQLENTYRLKLNFNNMCVDIFGQYAEEKTGKAKEHKLGALPLPCDDLTWIINRAHYVLRGVAQRDNAIIKKVSFEEVKGFDWSYNIRENKFYCNIKEETEEEQAKRLESEAENKLTKSKKKTTYISNNKAFEPTIEEIFNNHLNARSREYLKAIAKVKFNEELTIENFTACLKHTKEFAKDSIFNYKFSQFDYIRKSIYYIKGGSSWKDNKLIGFNKAIITKHNIHNSKDPHINGVVIASDSQIHALENFRTVSNGYITTAKNTFIPEFTYTDATGFFDHFKTSTTKEAGRIRLLLDNVFIKDGMLWVLEDDGELHNMYEYYLTPGKERLSCLSKSPFCNNDKAKRIMMTAKMSTQAVKVANEVDPFMHRIHARVGFTDIEGYTTADSIIISESFAEKLRCYEEKFIYCKTSSNLYNIIENIIDKDGVFDIESLRAIFNKNDAILNSYENVHIEKIDRYNKDSVRILFKWEIPFRLGDKITNLHGAKGTVGRIIPDDEMPRLMKKVGNMEPGPLEVILSGFSTIRRGSLGQIFEAWALASGIDFSDDQDYAAIMMDKYIDQMKEFSKNSIVQYKGVKQTIPLGINTFMRLNKHSVTMLSCSGVDNPGRKYLRFGEMEKLNMLTNGCTNILRELGIRSMTKYVGAKRLINEMEDTRELPANAHMSLHFVEILKSIGYDLTIDKRNISDLSVIDDKDLLEFNGTTEEEIELGDDDYDDNIDIRIEEESEGDTE